jgi:hypothetical protein
MSATSKVKNKTNISIMLKRIVWNNYFGEECGKAKCPCCKLSDITQLTFHCGHIMAEAHGGQTVPSNLMPLCASCNLSMGTKNAYDIINMLSGNIVKNQEFHDLGVSKEQSNATEILSRNTKNNIEKSDTILRFCQETELNNIIERIYQNTEQNNCMIHNEDTFELNEENPHIINTIKKRKMPVMYACVHCDKVFDHKGHYNTHLEMHIKKMIITDITPKGPIPRISCKYCGGKFLSVKGRDIHINKYCEKARLKKKSILR